MPHRGGPSRSLAHWNRKQKGGTWTVIRLCPKTAVMSLDDGAADGEADTHAVAFRRVEGVEQLGHALRVDADAGIAHAHAHTIVVLLFGSDQQLPRPIVHGGHRIRGVAEQVQDDLLELNTVPRDRGEVLGELHLKRYVISLKPAHSERSHRSRGPVQVD